MKKLFPLVFFLFLSLLFFSDYITKGYVPIPSDIIVGHYYPWKDYIWNGREAGFPIKNFHLYDQITQNYPWKKLTIDLLKKGQVPLWNPYNMTGVPHLANLATASLYPGNILFMILPFISAWNLLIFLEIFLSGIFMYYYLNNLKIKLLPSLVGAITFSLSTFLSTTYEFLVIAHTFLWVPLILLSIDKLFSKITLKWWFIGIFSISMMILGGHLQILIYGYFLITSYLIYRFFENWKNKFEPNKTIALILFLIVPILLTMVQLLPLLEVISKSNRLISYGKYEDIIAKNTFPFRRLITILIPDFFGNPSRSNFWEEISYFEYSVYSGVFPLILAITTFFIKRDKKTYFWQFILIISFAFMLNSPIAKIPYLFEIPGYSSLVPVRLISLVSISISILSSFGLSKIFDRKFNKSVLKTFIKINIILFLIFCIVIMVIIFFPINFIWPGLENNTSVALKNSLIPGFLILFVLAVLLYIFKINGKYKNFLIFVIIIITSIDLLRQAKKFNTFIPANIIYPQTASLSYLSSMYPPPRVMITNTELLPANTNLFYGFSKISGYDSIHSKRIEDLLKVLNQEDIKAKDTLNIRDLYIANFKSLALNLVSPQFVYSLDEIEDKAFEQVFVEGKTKLYKNKRAYPRAYLTQNIIYSPNNEESIRNVLNMAKKGVMDAVVEEDIKLNVNTILSNSSVNILKYEPNYVLIKSVNNAESLLVFNDAYDEGWKVKINLSEDKIFRVNYAFRGVKLSPGINNIEFYYLPESFLIGRFLSIFTFICLLIPILKPRSLRLR